MPKQVTFGQAAEYFRSVQSGFKEAAADAIEVGHKELMSRIPVFTGTYQDAVELGFTGRGYQLSITHEGLVASAERNTDDGSLYAYAEADPVKGDRFDLLEGTDKPYVERIEAIGSPVTDMGEGAWEAATVLVGDRFEEMLQKAVQ